MTPFASSQSAAHCVHIYNIVSRVVLLDERQNLWYGQKGQRYTLVIMTASTRGCSFVRVFCVWSVWHVNTPEAAAAAAMLAAAAASPAAAAAAQRARTELQSIAQNMNHNSTP